MNTSLKSISELLHLVSNTNHYEKALHALVEKVVQNYHCQSCAVVLIDSKTEYLSIENCHGISYTFCKAYRRKLATGAIGELLWTGKPILIADSEAHPEIASEIGLENPFASCIAVQISIDQRTLGFLYLDSKKKNCFQEEDVPAIQAFADVAGLAIHKARLHDDIVRLEIVDKETGLDRYGHFLLKLQAAIKRGQDTHENFSLLLMDIDNSKAIINTYGLENAGKFLFEFGQLIKDNLGPMDVAGRYGFDEFIVLHGSTTLEESWAFAQRLKTSVENTVFTPERIRTTISTGMAPFVHQGKVNPELVQTVKRALFEAQRSGRNKVYCFEKL